jgi:hypothetical protein
MDGVRTGLAWWKYGLAHLLQQARIRGIQGLILLNFS